MIINQIIPTEDRTSDDNVRSIDIFNREDVIEINKNLFLTNEALVQVPSVLKSDNSVSVLGQVKRPDSYFINDNTTLKTILDIAGGFEDLNFRKSILDEKIVILRKDGESIYSIEYTVSYENADDFILNQIHGEYWIKVEDAIGCYVTDTFEITQPMPLKIQLNSIDVKCFNGSDGQIISSVNGGTSPYSYDWSFSGNSFSNNPNATNLPALNQPYLLTVTDDNSCENSVFTYINQPESLELEISSLNQIYLLLLDIC